MHLRGWTQYDLSQRAGISQMTVSNSLAGKTVSGRTARRVAEAFDNHAPVLDGWLGETA
jgi:DNA-binding LacI/PurR family transcriptional regulator